MGSARKCQCEGDGNENERFAATKMERYQLGREKNVDQNQIGRFKEIASELGLAQAGPDSLDRIMRKLDLTKKPDEKDGKKDE